MAIDIRKFNRFELKYVLDVDFAREVMEKLQDYMQPDSHGDAMGNYTLSSLYYDTDDFRFYWEKVEGIKFRRKLRLRIYETEKKLSPRSKVFVEIKQRMDKVTQKRRFVLTYKAALEFCNNYKIDFDKLDPEEVPYAEEMLDMLQRYQLKPQCITSYQRRAFNGGDFDPGLRVTFDTNLRYRRNDLDLDQKKIGPLMLPPDKCIMEIKANDRIPYWLTEFAADRNFRLMRISKYCTSLERADAVPHFDYQFL